MFMVIGYDHRYVSVIHARLRNKCSNLNSDLCNNHLKEYPYCECAEVVEDAEHYFFQCPMFQNQRTTLLQSLHAFIPLNTAYLLKGNLQLHIKQIAQYFQQFIHISKQLKGLILKCIY